MQVLGIYSVPPALAVQRTKEDMARFLKLQAPRTVALCCVS